MYSKTIEKHIQIINGYLSQCTLILYMKIVKTYMNILILYFSIAEQQWLNYYLRMYKNHDTVIKKIRANRICPVSIERLYDSYYKEYSYYYRED